MFPRLLVTPPTPRPARPRARAAVGVLAAHVTRAGVAAAAAVVLAVGAACSTSPTDPAARAASVPDALAVQVVPGGGAWLGGAARDSLGVGPDAAVRFASGDSGAVTVDTLGTVAGVRPGRTVVTASAGGRTARLAVLVRTVRYAAAYPRGALAGCALTDAGEALCWGDNGVGQLGAETGVLCHSGRTLTCGALPSEGPVFVATAERFRSLTVSTFRTCGLTVDGRALCWGGVAADIKIAVSSCDAVPNGRCRFAPTDVGAGRTFQALSTDSYYYSASTACGVAADGRAACWGANNVGQAGTGTRDTVPSPTPVQGDAQYRSVRVDAWLNHGCGLTTDGGARCWGLLGRTVVPSPTPAAPGERFVALAGDDCGLTAAGDVRCWSWDGGAPQTAAAGLQLMQVSGVCGLTAGGDAYCWDPGDPLLSDYLTQVAPARVAAGLRFRTLEANYARDADGVCGVATDGVAYCFAMHASSSDKYPGLVPRPIPGQG